MKYFFILMFLGSLGEGYYVRSNMPVQWNSVIAMLKVPEPGAESVTPDQRQINDRADKIVASAISVATNLQAAVVAPKAPAPTKVFVPPNPLPARADWTWTTSDGKTYKNVVITKVDADCVTILDADGGARLEIALLPADLQQQLNFDPELAANAEVRRGEHDQASEAAIEQAEEAARQAKLKKELETDANTAKIQENGQAKDAAVDADLRVQNAKARISDMEDDLKAVSKHVYFVFGTLSGEAYYVNKYNTDKQQIAACQAIIDAGGK